jgi:Fe-S-cluster containining protein
MLSVPMSTETPKPRGDAGFLAELQALYARVDALYADWSCGASTECCRFGITGRQPYVTGIEALAVRSALARLGEAVSEKRRALPMLMAAERERVCPLLNREKRCSVYEVRPLGCRTYFCERANKGAGPSRAQLQEITHELQELAARHQLGGDAQRPLLRVLDAGWGG